MYNVDSGNFLLSVINGAEDIDLFLSKYNACLADDVLRSNIEFDHRPIVVIGTEKRHLMCRKKLPQKFKEIKKPYDESKVHFITNENLKDFVTKALAVARGEEPEVPALEYTPQDTLSEQKVINDSAVVEIVTTTELETVDNTDSSNEEKVVVEENAEEQEVVTTQSHSSVGLCKYGVPMLEVEYITPNVIGLKESLFVNVGESDLQNFFEAMRSRVISSVNKNI